MSIVTKIQEEANGFRRSLVHELGKVGVPREQIIRCDSFPEFMLMMQAYNDATRGRLTNILGIDAQRGNEIFHQIYFQFRWKKFGMPVFSLTKNLSSALILTDCGAIESSEVKFPFDSFMITLDSTGSPLSVVSLQTNLPIEASVIKVHRYSGWKHDDAYGVFNDAMPVIARARTGQASQDEFINAARSLASLEEQSWVRIEISCDDKSEIHLNWPMPADGRKMHELLDCLKDPDDESLLTKSDVYALRAAARLVVSLLLYLNSDSVKKPWINKPSSQGDGFGRARVWPVGREIKLPAVMHEAANAFAENGAARIAWKIHSRYTVRGHWRNQACGPSMQEHKRIWIQPYWKGPDDGQNLARRYSVDLPGQHNNERSVRGTKNISGDDAEGSRSVGGDS